MKIIKYNKVSNNKYDVILENNEKIKLYEDVILKEELLLKKEINDIDKILEINSKYEIYDVSLKYLNHHVISIKGMKEYLKRKKYQEIDINNTINKLIKNGYLNDKYYAKCYISDHVNLSNDGPLKIKRHLEDNDISYNDYSEYLKIDDNIWINKINEYLIHQLKVNKKSNYCFKNKMLLNLINLGYEREMINECLSHVEVKNIAVLKSKEEEKIRIKLARKYSGEELEYRIKQKLYQKGFFE